MRTPVEFLTWALAETVQPYARDLRAAGWPTEVRVDLDGPGRALTVNLSITVPLPPLPVEAVKESAS